MHFNERDNQLKISHTDFETFAKCEKMWALSQDKSIPRLPSAALINGSAFHSTLEAILRGSRDKDLLPMYQQEELMKRGMLDLEAYKQKDTKLVEKVVEFRDVSGPQCVDLFMKRVLPKLRPLDVEYWATRELYQFDGKSYALHCKIDYQDERGFICDWKTTGQSPAAAKIERGHLMQARINMFCDQKSDFRFVYFGGSGKSPAVYKQEIILEDELDDWAGLRSMLPPMIFRMEEIVFGGVDPIPAGYYRTAYAEGQCDYCDYRDRCPQGACRMVAGGKIEK
jgi:hypothetical protein